MKNKKLQKILDAILIPVLAILSGLVLMGILIALTGKPVWESYGVLFSKAFGCEKASNCAILTTLERATPIILTGLSAVVAFRSGLFSIGQEGQYLMASIAAGWLGYNIHLPQRRASIRYSGSLHGRRRGLWVHSRRFKGQVGRQ